MKKIITVLLIFILAAYGALSIRGEAADLSSSAGAVTVSSGNLNVRKSPSGSAAVVGSVKKGSHITLMKKSGSWWYVEYGDGVYGYCHSDYITPIQGTAVLVSTSSGNLNVRSGAGTGYSVKSKLPGGEAVILLSSSGGWSRILYNGIQTGYVSSAYLTSSGTYGTVSIYVPSFKQYDSRWSGVTLGSTGKTIGSIGCATTAIAMLESQRTGSVITPAAMANRLSYTASGSVYWPEHYTAVTSSSGYLRGIYDKLKQGKPILLGLKNYYGGQHWVVVTGFTGGSSLTASSFTINDPGSSQRTNLQQLLNTYPVFYKYFYC